MELMKCSGNVPFNEPMFIDENKILNEPRFLNSPWLSTNYIDWSFLKSYGMIQHYKIGELISVNSNNEPIYYIEHGRVRMSTLSENGEEKVILIIDQGNIINISPLLERLPSNLFFITVKDSRLYRINNEVYQNLMKSDYEFSMKIIMDLSRKLRIMISHVEDMAFMNASSRIAKYLYRLSYDYGIPSENGIKLNSKFTHHEMAAYVGTSRVTVSKVLENMKRAQILAKENGSLIIKDVQRLKECINYPKW